MAGVEHPGCGLLYRGTKLYSALKRRRSSIPTKGPSSPVRRSPTCSGHRDQHDGKGRWVDNVFVERVDKSLILSFVAQRQVRGRVPASLRNAHDPRGFDLGATFAGPLVLRCFYGINTTGAVHSSTQPAGPIVAVDRRASRHFMRCTVRSVKARTPAKRPPSLARYFGFYNTRRRHSALDRRTPDAVYFDQAHRDLAA